MIYRDVEVTKPQIIDSKCTIKISGGVLTGKSINEIAKRLKYIITHFANRKLSIVINLGTKRVPDNLVVMILEHLIYDFLKNTVSTVKVRLKIEDPYFTYNLLRKSFLSDYIGENIDKDKYLYLFESNECLMKKDIDGRHCFFRQRIDYTAEKEFLSENLLMKVNAFLKLSHIFDVSFASDIIDIVSEVCGNSFEHAKSGFILEIHVSCVNRNDQSAESGKMVMISILSVNEKYLYTDLQDLIINTNQVNQEKLFRAFGHHSKHFGSDYTLQDFSIVSAFQRGISTRRNQLNSGGTGLTNLIAVLQESMARSEDVYCYLLTDRNILFFRDNYIKESQKGIGFNKSNNYFDEIPEKDYSIDRSYFPLTGTAYYLQLFKGGI